MVEDDGIYIAKMVEEAGDVFITKSTKFTDKEGTLEVEIVDRFNVAENLASLYDAIDRCRSSCIKGNRRQCSAAAEALRNFIVGKTKDEEGNKIIGVPFIGAFASLKLIYLLASVGVLPPSCAAYTSPDGAGPKKFLQEMCGDSSVTTFNKAFAHAKKCGIYRKHEMPPVFETGGCECHRVMKGKPKKDIIFVDGDGYINNIFTHKLRASIHRHNTKDWSLCILVTQKDGSFEWHNMHDLYVMHGCSNSIRLTDRIALQQQLPSWYPKGKTGLPRLGWKVL